MMKMKICNEKGRHASRYKVLAEAYSARLVKLTPLGKESARGLCPVLVAAF